VPLYESKGKIIEKNQPKYPVGFSEEYVREVKERHDAAQKKTQSIPGLTCIPNNSKKKKKKSNSHTKPPDADDLLVSNNVTTSAMPQSSKENEWTTVGKQQPVKKKAEEKVVKKEKQSGIVAQEAVDPAKRVKNLRRRLKEMELIAEKKAKGEKLEKDQVEKLSRKGDVEEEIVKLIEKFDIS